MQVHQLHGAIRIASDFEDHLCDDGFAYEKMSNYIYSKLAKRPVGDADIQRFFIGRQWLSTSEVEVHIRQIAKNETRAGILRRIDLEGAEGASCTEQVAPI